MRPDWVEDALPQLERSGLAPPAFDGDSANARSVAIYRLAVTQHGESCDRWIRLAIADGDLQVHWTASETEDGATTWVAADESYQLPAALLGLRAHRLVPALRAAHRGPGTTNAIGLRLDAGGDEAFAGFFACALWLLAVSKADPVEDAVRACCQMPSLLDALRSGLSPDPANALQTLSEVVTVQVDGMVTLPSSADRVPLDVALGSTHIVRAWLDLSPDPARGAPDFGIDQVTLTHPARDDTHVVFRRVE